MKTGAAGGRRGRGRGGGRRRAARGCCGCGWRRGCRWSRTARRVYLKDTEGEQAVGVDGTFALLALAFGVVSAARRLPVRRRGGVPLVVGARRRRAARLAAGLAARGVARARRTDVVAHAKAVGQGRHVRRAAGAGGEGGAAGLAAGGDGGPPGADGAVRARGIRSPEPLSPRTGPGGPDAARRRAARRLRACASTARLRPAAGRAAAGLGTPPACASAGAPAARQSSCLTEAAASSSGSGAADRGQHRVREGRQVRRGQFDLQAAAARRDADRRRGRRPRRPGPCGSFLRWPSGEMPPRT